MRMALNLILRNVHVFVSKIQAACQLKWLVGGAIALGWSFWSEQMCQTIRSGGYQVEKEVPQPQVPVALGLLNLKPPP